MSRVFVDAKAYRETPTPGFVLEGAPLRHATRVLRLEEGDALLLVDGSGTEYVCRLGTVDKRFAWAEIVERRALAGDAKCQVHLFVAALKGEKLDWVLQKTTELGVASITVFDCERALARPSVSRGERWKSLVASAVAQSGRATVPDVIGPIEFDAMLVEARNSTLAIMPWEGTSATHFTEALAKMPPSIALVVGPEGGFSRDEAARAEARGILPVTLGDRILRAETAAVACVTMALFKSGDLG